MTKILVELYLPVTMHSFDMFIPVSSKIGEVLELIKRILPELSGGLQYPSEETALCSRETGKALPNDQTVQEAGLRDGSELYVL